MDEGSEEKVVFKSAPHPSAFGSHPPLVGGGLKDNDLPRFVEIPSGRCPLAPTLRFGVRQAQDDTTKARWKKRRAKRESVRVRDLGGENRTKVGEKTIFSAAFSLMT